ncbi:hypothetical protein K438DRAFT_558275 [Mycena galopus ATCC 62051]|nr:hypothetical protein K438DRAFT_558275 [Mycena galopus ATCC 62051]
MATLTELPPELILHIASFLTREIILDPKNRLHRRNTRHGHVRKPKLLPDLPSINGLSQTNIAFHWTLDQTLYSLCASVEHLGVLALLFAVEHGMEHAFDKLVAVEPLAA